VGVYDSGGSEPPSAASFDWQIGSPDLRMLKRLRLHGLLKKIHGSYRYYLTRLGKTLITTALKLKTLVIIPSLAEPTKMTA